jgi:hypothetical protein
VSRGLRRVGRILAIVLWFGVDGGWIYYIVLSAYAVLVSFALWLLSRPGWLPLVGALTVLIDGLAVTLFLLHRWLGRRLRQFPPR